MKRRTLYSTNCIVINDGIEITKWAFGKRYGPLINGSHVFLLPTSGSNCYYKNQNL
jgi:hypothetical protein